MVEKEVKVKVATDVEASEVEALEKKIEALKKEKLQFQVDTATQKLDETRSKIEELKKQKATLEVGADDSEIKKIDAEISQLEGEAVDLQLTIDKAQLKEAEAEVEELDGRNIELNLAMENFTQGLATAKQGVSELKSAVDEALAGAGKRETNETFLQMSIGAKDAETAMTNISKVVQDLPGDDTAIQGLLSSAAAKNAKMTAAEMKAMGSAAADYFSAMSFYGKSATESQQDMTNYILAGNTAELERSPILQGHIDKLKEANTVQERTQALQEALKEEGWLDMSQQDTYNNKLETFNGMLQRGQDNLGKMFMEGSKGAMDFALKLDEDTNGLFGMGLAAMSFAGPFTDIMSGIGQIGMGFKTLGELNIFEKLGGKLDGFKNRLKDIGTTAKNVFTGLPSKLSALKTALIDIGGKAKEAAIHLASLGKQALVAGYNALKSAAMWVVQKAQMVASTIATYAAEAAQWALNVAMSMNPITIIIIAIVALIAVLGYLYFNNEQVRDAINNLGQTFVMVGQIIYTAMMNAVNWVIGALQNLWTYIITLGGLLPANVSITGNQIIDTILRVVAFLLTLPLQVAMIFTNIIAKALGFGNNFSQRMLTAAVNAVSRFASSIAQLPGKLQTELNNMLSAVGRWAATLPQKFWEAGVNAVKNFLSALGIASPGTMQRMLVWEVSEMGRRTPIEGRKLVSNVAQLGADIVDSFGDPKLGIQFDDTANATIRQIGTSNSNDVPLPNITLNVEVGTVDSTDRVNEIVDAIRRELAWNNTTAGRSV